MCWNGQLTAGCREVRGCWMTNSNLFVRLRQSQADKKGRAVKYDLNAIGKFFLHGTQECLLKSSKRSKYTSELNYTSESFYLLIVVYWLRYPKWKPFSLPPKLDQLLEAHSLEYNDSPRFKDWRSTVDRETLWGNKRY